MRTEDDHTIDDHTTIPFIFAPSVVKSDDRDAEVHNHLSHAFSFCKTVGECPKDKPLPDVDAKMLVKEQHGIGCEGERLPDRLPHRLARRQPLVSCGAQFISRNSNAVPEA